MYEKSTEPQSPIHGVLLSKALTRFRSELKDDDECILDVGSVDELLSQARALEPPVSRKGKLSTLLNRLEPILSHINDFAAVVAVCSGADPKATGVVWGSLRVILTLASPAGDKLNHILDMLDELSLALPRFRSYEETLPMTRELESALLGVYTEMMCFCARTINFFRSNPHRQLVRFGWSTLNDDFKLTIKRLQSLSRLVDTEAEAIRLRTDSERNTELLAAIELLKDKPTTTDRLPCHHIPFGCNEQFYGREDILKRVKKALSIEQRESQRKCVTLHGLGGVGKTRIALQYATYSRDQYDAIFWIAADNPLKLTQSFLEVSRRLGLTPENDAAQDAVAATSKVKSWLEETCCRWLVVFDNADNPEVLLNAWPGGAAGSILLTTRDFTAGFGTSTEGLHVRPFDEEAGISAFLGLVGRDPQDSSAKASAKEIVQVLGGLPLALNQIGGFIVQQRLALEKFLPLYERNSAKIHARRLIRGNYEHTLSTVWELALGQLSGPSSTLQKLLAFFDPDKIHESVLQEGADQTHGKEYDFLHDEMDFLDAKESLLRAALIDRYSEDATLAVHRLVQVAVMKRLSPEEKVKHFDQAITLLSNGFPNTWNTVTSHQFTAWTKCELCLPHVNFLIGQSKRYKLHPSNSKKFAELLFRYLYEREHYYQAREFMQTGFEVLQEEDTLTCASASMLQGLIELDTNNVTKALTAFLEALDIREKVLDPEDAFIASSLNAISLAYTELGILDKALETGRRAIDIRLRTGSDRIGNSYSNMASTLLRMGRPDEAEEMLKRCPSLKDFTDETFLNTGNPRFSGDMVLLSRIRQQQGRLDEALRLSSKALAFRQKLLGNRMKTCDSLYQVANLLQIRGDLSSSINLLGESVSIAENLPETGGYLARSYCKLGHIHAALGNAERSRVCKEAAEATRQKILGLSMPQDVSDESYDKLVLWMLW
ncbi:MAG: hypothetical protein M1837_003955 [Sclerophora amabilis]|nr:MAG: hypothetical protein M1837_003955 [Sclerophora amabilis]